MHHRPVWSWADAAVGAFFAGAAMFVVGVGVGWVIWG